MTMAIGVFLLFFQLFESGTRALQLNLSGGGLREAFLIQGESLELAFAIQTVKPPLWESSLPDSWRTIEETGIVYVGRSYTPLYWPLQQNINKIKSVLDDYRTPIELRNDFYDRYSKEAMNQGDPGFIVVHDTEVYVDFRFHKTCLFNKSELKFD